MKTLDEVIYQLENCAYAPLTDDACHYLKEYRERLQNLQDMMDRYDISVKNYEEAVENCRIAEQKYWRNTNNVEDMIPLTWDELKQMVGKPVWVEYFGANRWIIPQEFRFDIAGREYLLAQDGGMIFRFQQHDVWQAYRKERE